MTQREVSQMGRRNHAASQQICPFGEPGNCGQRLQRAGSLGRILNEKLE
jgi:hypothetical protein